MGREEKGREEKIQKLVETKEIKIIFHKTYYEAYIRGVLILKDLWRDTHDDDIEMFLNLSFFIIFNRCGLSDTRWDIGNKGNTELDI